VNGAATARQGGAFALIGLAATCVHVIMALAARSALHLEPLAANFVGYGCAVGFSYIGNARLTFGRPAWDAGQFSRFLLVSLLGLALNQAIVHLLVDRAGWPFWLALGPVVVLVPLLSFVLLKIWAFGERGLRRGPAADGR
jgi:putative flippase GtrA